VRLFLEDARMQHWRELPVLPLMQLGREEAAPKGKEISAIVAGRSEQW
jgi:hypothetical protein